MYWGHSDWILEGLSVWILGLVKNMTQVHLNSVTVRGEENSPYSIRKKVSKDLGV